MGKWIAGHKLHVLWPAYWLLTFKLILVIFAERSSSAEFKRSIRDEVATRMYRKLFAQAYFVTWQGLSFKSALHIQCHPCHCCAL